MLACVFEISIKFEQECFGDKILSELYETYVRCLYMITIGGDWKKKEVVGLAVSITCSEVCFWPELMISLFVMPVSCITITNNLGGKSREGWRGGVGRIEGLGYGVVERGEYFLTVSVDLPIRTMIRLFPKSCAEDHKYLINTFHIAEVIIRNVILTTTYLKLF